MHNGAIWKGTFDDNGMLLKIHENAYTIGYSALLSPDEQSAGKVYFGDGVFYDAYQKNNKVLNPSLSTLVDMLDFNPFSEDGAQFYWYDGETLMVPQGEWIWPMADWSCVFDSEGIAIQERNSKYDNWLADYKMYTYEEKEILSNWKMLCGEV